MQTEPATPPPPNVSRERRWLRACGAAIFLAFAANLGYEIFVASPEGVRNEAIAAAAFDAITLPPRLPEPLSAPSARTFHKSARGEKTVYAHTYAGRAFILDSYDVPLRAAGWQRASSGVAGTYCKDALTAKVDWTAGATGSPNGYGFSVSAGTDRNYVQDCNWHKQLWPDTFSDLLLACGLACLCWLYGRAAWTLSPEELQAWHDTVTATSPGKVKVVRWQVRLSSCS